MTHMSDTKQAAKPPATATKSAEPLIPCVIGGIVAGLLLVLVLGWILDAESKGTVLWQKGRILIVALTAFAGGMVGQGKGRVVAENIECFAIAVVMALILKHFIIEAYKIPTGSMQPTILGNDNVGIFDRVLVNKFAYLVDEPERYDVVVFKYPLDRSKNYIKRLIGLSDEQVAIANGNIYVAPHNPDGTPGTEHIARKPRDVRNSVMKTLFPSGNEGETIERSFEAVEGTWHVDGDEVTLEANSKIHFGHGEPIRDRYLDGYDPDWKIPSAYPLAANGTENVGDLSIGFDVAPDPTCEEIEITIFAYGLEHRAILGVGKDRGLRLESGARDRDGALTPPDFYQASSPIVGHLDGAGLAPGESTTVCFSHVDQQLILEVDGREVLTFGYEISAPLRDAVNGIEITARGGKVELEGIEVRRDIHYTTNGSRRLVFDVPADSLFVMGDNTQNSSDGRVWSAQELRFPNGDTIITEYRQAPSNNSYTDIFGERYPSSPRNPPRIGQVADASRFSFVPRRLLLGKAIAVFWPIYPHFRWKLIR